MREQFSPIVSEFLPAWESGHQILPNIDKKFEAFWSLMAFMIDEASPRASPHQNLTGTKRIVKDLAATIHSSIQQWNNLHIHGVEVLKTITAMKVDESFPEGLQELCDTLEKDVDQLDQVVSNLKLSLHQVSAAMSLHRGPEKLFTTWPNERFVEVVQSIYDAYNSEAKIKRTILENVAHDSRDSWKMAHLAAWVHQPMIPLDLNVILESLLIETGHR